jgi:hypothetical protein
MIQHLELGSTFTSVQKVGQADKTADSVTLTEEIVPKHSDWQLKVT